MKSIKIKDNNAAAVYSGKVKVTVKSKTGTKFKIAHNAGTDALAQYLASALAGENIYSKVPSRIELFDADDMTVFNTSTTIPYDGTIEKSEDGKSIKLSFFIPGSILDNGKTVATAKLYDPSGQIVYAICDLSEGSIVTDPSSNIQITWQLSIAVEV